MCTCLFHLLLIIVYVPQRQDKVQDTFLKCSKARNIYLLNLAAANASMKKYYLQDISTLIDVSALVHTCACLVIRTEPKNYILLNVMIPPPLGPFRPPGPICSSSETLEHSVILDLKHRKYHLKYHVKGCLHDRTAPKLYS